MSSLQDLGKIGLMVQCPACEEEFSLKDAEIFDVRQPLPSSVNRYFKAREKGLLKEEALLKRKLAKLAGELDKKRKECSKLSLKVRNQPVRLKITTQSVNLGFILEKILPSTPRFKFELADCRALFTPVDYVSFNGHTRTGRVDSITFLEIKTGDAQLQKNQKSIRDAVGQRRLEIQTYSHK